MARESFILGMKPNLVVRVRLGKPNTLQEAISIGKGMEWELDYFKNLTGEKRENNETTNFDRGYPGNRFRPYKPSARVHAIKQEIRGGFLNSGSVNKVRDGGKSVRGGRREGGSNAPTAMTCFRCVLLLIKQTNFVNTAKRPDMKLTNVKLLPEL